MKLGIHVSKRTVPRYMSQARKRQPHGGSDLGYLSDGETK
jgi:hypothetical protein